MKIILFIGLFALSAAAGNLPSNFDAREKWPDCSSLIRIQKQGNCRSDWAFAVASVLSDRFCIQSHENVDFSELDLMSCCLNCGSPCGAGSPKAAWNHARRTGVVSGGIKGCKNFTTLNETTGVIKFTEFTCRRKCQSSYARLYTRDLMRLRVAYEINDETSIMTEIESNGPVTAMMEVYEDFYYYASGIYRHTTGESLGYHTVKLIGWGEENDKKYWLAASTWIDKGFFKIPRGENYLGIEDNVYAGLF